jgi:DNA polymerase-1
LQGSAADIIKLAMIAVDKRLEGMKSKMILQVHDELIIDAYEDEVDEVKAILEEEMANAVKLNVPLVAEAVVGDSWADL